MEKQNPSCPVCTLYLREGITLQDHLETHPKEQVIEALLKITSNGSGSVSSANQPVSSPVSAYLPATQTFGATNTTFMSPSQQYASPQTQMTTAVTYQHFMTSNGSTIMPQYIQVPTIVTSNSNIPVLPNQPVNFLPNQNGAYTQTMYNPLYNPFIPQPYPMIQTMNPMFSGFPVSSVQPSESNTQVSSSQVPVSCVMNDNQAAASGTEMVHLQKCTAATNTTLSPEEEEGDASISKTESLPKQGSSKSAVRRRIKVVKKQSKPKQGTKQPKQTSDATPSRSDNGETSNAANDEVVNSAANKTNVSSSKTSVITRAKALRNKTNSSSSSCSSSCSGMISPPPLTLITRSRSNSLSCSQTPPPPPLSKAPFYVTPSKLQHSEYALNLEEPSSPQPLSAPVITETECLSITKVTEYLRKHHDINVSNSVIVESSKRVPDAVSKETSNENTNSDFHNNNYELPSNASLYQKNDSVMNESVQHNEESQEIENEFNNNPVNFEERKVTLTFEIPNQDIPKEISSANIERNCDGSDIFIQQENIPFNEPVEELRTSRVNQTEFVDVEGNDMGNNQANQDGYYGKDYDSISYQPNREPELEEPPKYTDLQPVTYTDLQPATSPRVFQDLSLPGTLSFTNFMEIDGIKIFFNNSTRTIPNMQEPIIKFNASSLTDTRNVSNCLKSESEMNDNPIVESVIQLVTGGSELKNDFAIGDNFSATTSQINDGHLDLPDLSPLTLNIQADESMPARGELSEQESLGAENSNWGLFHGDIENAKDSDEWKQDPEVLRNVPETNKPTKKSFRCSICNEIFSCPKERRVHKNTVHLNVKTERSQATRKPRNFECVYCHENFTCLRDRRLHVIQRHSAELKIKKNASDKIKEEWRDAKNSNECESLEGGDAKIKGENEPNVKNEASEAIGKSQYFVSKNCTRCNFVFNTLKGLREHLREAHGEVRFKCGTCTASFDEESEYNAHLKVHPLVCNQCGKMFYRKPNLNLHMKRHLDIKPYECSLCPKSFITRQKLEEHMNGHSGNKPIKCTLCDRTFSRHSNLIQHRNMHHLKVKKKIKDYVCRCGEVFHSVRKLEWHKEIHEAKPKTCPFCSQKFIHNASVTRHVRRSHMPEYLPGDNREFENVQCPICERIYLRSSLIVHMRVHNGEKPFICKICNKRFSTKWNLELHNWTHQSRSNMPFKCSVCKSAFFRESDYVAHLNSHKNFKPYTCNICGQKFIRKYNCLRHQEEHKKAKRFVCTVSGCEKSFHRSYYLKDHMKVHTGVRPHTCHICGKASSTKSNHNKHVRIHDTREPVNTEN